MLPQPTSLRDAGKRPSSLLYFSIIREILLKSAISKRKKFIRKIRQRGKKIKEDCGVVCQFDEWFYKSKSDS